MNTGPSDCASGRKTCANVGSLDPDKLGYCPGCYDHIRSTVVIPFEEFRQSIEWKKRNRSGGGSRGGDEEEASPPPARREPPEPRPLDGTVYGAAMVWSAKLKCEKCKGPCPAGSLVIGTPGTKTVERAYDPGIYVWRGPVNITKLRHPNCVPVTKRMITQLKEAVDNNEEVAEIFRGGPFLPPSVKVALEEWVRHVTSDEAEAERKAKRAAAQGINPDGTKKPRGNFKPKGPPEAWRKMAKDDPDQLMEKSATALKNFLKTYTYEKVPKSISKKKLVETITGLFAAEGA